MSPVYGIFVCVGEKFFYNAKNGNIWRLLVNRIPKILYQWHENYIYSPDNHDKHNDNEDDLNEENHNKDDQNKDDQNKDDQNKDDHDKDH